MEILIASQYFHQPELMKLFVITKATHGTARYHIGTSIGCVCKKLVFLCLSHLKMFVSMQKHAYILYLASASKVTADLLFV